MLVELPTIRDDDVTRLTAANEKLQSSRKMTVVHETETATKAETEQTIGAADKMIAISPIAGEMPLHGLKEITVGVTAMCPEAEETASKENDGEDDRADPRHLQAQETEARLAVDQGHQRHGAGVEIQLNARQSLRSVPGHDLGIGTVDDATIDLADPAADLAMVVLLRTRDVSVQIREAGLRLNEEDPDLPLPHQVGREVGPRHNLDLDLDPNLLRATATETEARRHLIKNPQSGAGDHLADQTGEDAIVRQCLGSQPNVSVPDSRSYLTSCG